MDLRDFFADADSDYLSDQSADSSRSSHSGSFSANTNNPYNRNNPSEPTFRLQGPNLSQTAIDTWANVSLPRASPPATTNATTPTLSQARGMVREMLSQQQSTIQQLLTFDSSNSHWGDIPSLDPNNFRIVVKNVNSLSIAEDYYQWHGAIQAVLQLDAHLICFQETNLRWTQPISNHIYRLFQRAFQHTKIATSCSSDNTARSKKKNRHYLPGGTFTASLGRYSSRVIRSGSDETGLGRWTFMEMVGRHDRRLIFLNGYRVGRNQKYSVGSITAYCQQYRILQRAGHANPNPREIFIDDLITLVKGWIAAGHEVLLCLDANEESDQLSLDLGLGRLISTTGLIDLHRYHFSGIPTPATHQRGSKTINICLGTKLFTQALVKAWYLPFDLPITLTGDHRTVGLEFDHHILFGNKLPLVAPLQSRGVYSNAYPIVRKFNNNVAEACSNSNLYQ